MKVGDIVRFQLGEEIFVDVILSEKELLKVKNFVYNLRQEISEDKAMIKSLNKSIGDREDEIS